MDNNIQLLLLKIIKFNGDITPMLKLGYEYSQVANLIKSELSNENAEYINGDLIITSKGNLLISSLETNRQGGSHKWIEPEISSKIIPIDKDFVYLPNKKELTFKIS